MNLGEKIKKLRRETKTTLVELSQKSGVQVATLSRMENGKMTGTLESHMAIAKALGVDILELYSDLNREDSILDIKKEPSPADIFVHSEKASVEMLTSNIMKKKMMPTLLKLDPGGRTSTESAKPGTEKFIYILQGAATLHITDKSYPLNEGQSIYFDAAIEHWVECAGDNAAKALVISTPVAL